MPLGGLRAVRDAWPLVLKKELAAMRFAVQATLVAAGLSVLITAAIMSTSAPGEDEAELEVPVQVELEPGLQDEEASEDSPFDQLQSNALVAIGGGAGGRFGGRYGGRASSRAGLSGARYAELAPFGFVSTSQDTRSTFSVDVDTAAYANLRRLVTAGQLPPHDAVRIEELLNYFPYDSPLPEGDSPFALVSEVSECPWQPEHRLARVTLATQPVHASARPPANLVFLVDVSGSMSSATKLPLLKRSLQLLVDELHGRDRVALVAYAGAAGLVLPSSSCAMKQPLLAGIEALEAGGSTAGGAGIMLAYDVARQHFIEGGLNRVILATDGDFNVGVSSDEQLVQLVEENAAAGVELTVLGFGSGSFNDSMLEKISGAGNGNYAFVDTLLEARKVLVSELGATLETVAADAKIQVSFDPALVERFKLIGYENRRLEHEDFEDDTRDAGEVGAGHRVTALYEVSLHGGARPGEASWMSVAVRAKPPIAQGSGPAESRLLVQHEVVDHGATLASSSADHGFAAAVASFGLLLRSLNPPEGEVPQPAAAELELSAIRALTATSLGEDVGGYRAGFLALLDAAGELLEAGGADAPLEGSEPE